MVSETTHQDPVFAERALLGAMLLDKAAVHDGLFLCQVEDFREGLRRDAFEFMGEMAVSGTPIETMSVGHRLLSRRRAPTFTEVWIELTECTRMAALPGHVLAYAKAIAERGRLRRLRLKAADAVRAHGTISDVTTMLDRAVQDARLPEDEQPESIGDIVQRRYQALSDEAEGIVVPAKTKTGLDRVDRYGGWRPGEMIVLGGRPAMGKTALTWQVLEHAAKQCAPDETVLFFSLEMTSDELGERTLARGASVNTVDIRAGQIPDEAWGPMLQVVTAMAKIPLYVIPAASMSMEKMRAVVMRARATKRIKLVGIDYLQLMSSDRDHGSREQEISAVARGIKTLAKDAQTPVLVLSQLSRRVEGRATPEPMLSDLKESGDIEAAADKVVLIWRPFHYDESKDPTELQCDTAKWRHGPTGKWRLKFEIENSRFVDA